jgi:hypothetical protein
MIFPQADCINVTIRNADNGTTRQITPAPRPGTSSPDDAQGKPPGTNEPSCWTWPAKPATGKNGVPGLYPRITAEDYSK